MMGPGLFGDAFDFDGDGKLDIFEEAAEFAAFDAMTNPNAPINADIEYGMMRAGIMRAEESAFDDELSDEFDENFDEDLDSESDWDDDGFGSDSDWI